MRDSSVLGPPRRRGIFRGQRGLEFRVCGPVSFAVSRESRRHGDTGAKCVRICNIAFEKAERLALRRCPGAGVPLGRVWARVRA